MSIHMLPPMIGLGTFKVRSTEADESLVYRVLDTALTAGYRLIDTASCYRNEHNIGEALYKLLTIHNISRHDIYITSKVAPKDLGYESTIASCMKSISDLRCEYLDCCLIHWPGKAKLKPSDDQHAGYRRETWRELEELHGRGLVRCIGVSNFTVRHLQELVEYANIKPALNQVEFHVHLQQKELLEYCRNENIFVQSYSSLGTGQLVDDTTVVQLATKYTCTPAQLLLKWVLQQGVGVIPKSTNHLHIASNFNLDTFVISDDDMDVLAQLNVGKHYCWDPTLIN